MKDLYIETIRIWNGRVYNIKHHNNRCNWTRSIKYNSKNKLQLRNYIDIPPQYKNGLVKCRILYNDSIQKIEFQHYKVKPINSLKLVDIGSFEYSYKKEDRSKIQQYCLQKGAADDIIMVKNDLLTDTQYANIALSKNGKWYTPKTPLLMGTKRQLLLKNDLISPINISVSELYSYEKVSVFNAMIALGEISLDIKNCVF